MRGGRAEVLDDQAVGEEEDAVGDRGCVRVVGDHDGGLAVARDGLAQEREDLAAGARVEVAGRLVREHHRRLRDERTRDRDPLLLAARELGGTVREPLGEADRGGQLLEPAGVGLLAGDRERQDDVLLRGQHRQQVEELEDEADVLAPQLRQLRVVQLADRGAGDRRPSPAVGLSRPARMCISVDLPEPDGPITAVSSPLCDLDRDAARARAPRSRPRRTGG